MNKIVVLGNGPSLKGFDFFGLRNVDTLGMNAAYRYWDSIGWYPTHYVCLDDQVIESHAGAINELILSGKVKSAFLCAAILDQFPALLNEENVCFLESFNNARFWLSRRYGIPYRKAFAFADSDSSKVTTGAYSVRYAAFLGYKFISLLGIDLDYVEVITGAVQTGHVSMEMEATPARNPNYFFDGYQKQGDRFNLPNPAEHGCNLHVRSFETLAYDARSKGWPVRIFNSNRQSRIFSQQLLPYIPLDSFLQVDTPGVDPGVAAAPLSSWRPPLATRFRSAVVDTTFHALNVAYSRFSR